MERTGIEPVTSGLQILYGAGQARSSRVECGGYAIGSYRVRHEAPTMVSLI